ncbi:MAG: hypothetical protein DMD85_15425 [Candidatus Rokuibacteriota bacterium]|nr:MAG: hypothetical protein DMD85_15425 [Candidatus Rokubacteria bacterium]
MAPYDAGGAAMLTAEENALLTRVGPGTLMGDLMRQYWIPVVQSAELAAGGRPKRVRILGEDLVAYRDPAGRAALVSELCAHRRASLYFARNEASGLRCVYHGWQYAPDGRCIDQPNERPESNFQDKVTLPAYPCADRGGVVWAYMGPASAPPELGDLEWARVPDAQRFVSKFWQGCNWLQALEGGVDPAHISFLHGILDARDAAARRALDSAAAGFGFAAQLERAPHIEVADTPTGLLLGARREAPAGRYYWRITQYLLPFHTMPPPEVGEDPLLHAHVWIPMDDEQLVRPAAIFGPRPRAPTTTSPTGRRSARVSSSACRAWARRTRPSPRARAPTIARSSGWAAPTSASSACASDCSRRRWRCASGGSRRPGSMPSATACVPGRCCSPRTCRGSRAPAIG